MRHALALACFLALAGGCNYFGSGEGEATSSAARPAPGGVAIVDLDEVARRLGRDVQMVQAIQDKQDEINAQLATLQQRLQQQYQARRQELAAQPAQSLEEEQARQQQLDTLSQQLAQQLGDAQQAGRTELAQYKQRLVGSYREAARPICRQLAAERGLSIVMTKDEAHMLVYADAVDLTDAVTEQFARTTSPAAAPSAGGTSPAIPPVTAQAPSTSQQR